MSKKQEICSICMEEIQKDTYILSCDHKFHDDCMNKFIKSNIIILNNDNKRWAYLDITTHEYGFKQDPIMGLCDSGSFACPVCRKNYTVIHDDGLAINITSDIIMPTEYICKIKYAADNAGIYNLWYSHYIRNIDELNELYFPVQVSDSHDLKIFDNLVHNAYSRNIKNILTWHNENKDKNENLVLHAINCNCDKERCLGFFFVKESDCPLCNCKSTTIFSSHMEHLTPKQLENYVIKWDKILTKELIEHDFSTDNSSDSDNSFDIVQVPLVVNNSGTGRGRGTGRGTGTGRGRGRGANRGTNRGRGRGHGA